MLFLLLFLLLSNPKVCLAASVRGMTLWFDTLFPTLLPFIIISNIILNVYSKQMKNPSLYVIFIGLSCGCPMAAISAANLYENHRLTKTQAENLCGICNCLSPAFLMSYCFMNMLGFEKMPLRFLIATYAPLVLLLLLCHFKYKSQPQTTKHPNAPQESLIDILDRSILNGFTAITKLGGYIILCSILAAFAGLLVKSPVLNCILTGMIEVTNGIQSVGATSLPLNTKLVMTGAMLGFGGICCMFQAVSIMRPAGLSIKKYIYHKILIGILTTLAYLIVIYVS